MREDYTYTDDTPQIILEQAQEMHQLTTEAKQREQIIERNKNHIKDLSEELERLKYDIYQLKNTIQTLCAMVVRQGKQ